MKTKVWIVLGFTKFCQPEDGYCIYGVFTIKSMALYVKNTLEALGKKNGDDGETYIVREFQINEPSEEFWWLVNES